MSLRIRLLIIIGTSLSLVWTAVGLWMYRDFNREVRSVLDARLQASARMVSSLMDRLPTAHPDAPLPDVPPRQRRVWRRSARSALPELPWYRPCWRALREVPV
jgi:hypothetical protein